MELKNASSYILPSRRVIGYLPQDLALDVCSFFKRSIVDVKSPCRDRDLVNIRYTICYFIRNRFPSKTLEEIGLIINRNHSSVTEALRKFNNFLQTDKEFSSKTEELEEYLNQKAEEFFESFHKKK